MKRTTIILSILLVLTLLTVSVTPVLAKSATALDEDVPDMSDSKISESLKEKMEVADEDEKIPVRIWYQDVDQCGITKEAERNTYEEIRRIYPNLEFTDYLAIKCAKNYLGQKDEYKKKISDNINSIYIENRRRIAVQQYTKASESIIDKCSIKSADTEFCSRYAPMMIINLNKEEIKRTSKLSNIVSVNAYNNCKCEPCTIDSVLTNVNLPEIGIDTDWRLTGSNIKVGMVDTRFNGVLPNGTDIDNDIYVTRYVNGRELHDYGQIVFVTKSGVPINMHGYYTAEMLLSIAPDITLYCAYGNDELAISRDIEIMLAEGVNLINLSIAFYINETNLQYAYTGFEKFVDHIITNHDVMAIVAAGNEGNRLIKQDGPRVTSPGLANNAITVGALEEKGTNPNVPDELDTLMAYSGYKNKVGNKIGVEKPDVVMPTTYYTSYAAPVLTGMLALMMQLHYNLKTNMLALKAITIASCHRKAKQYPPYSSGISAVFITSEQEYMEDGITERQGAGVPDALVMANIISQGTYGVGTITERNHYINIEQPCYDASNMNVSLAWFRENTVNDSHTNVVLTGTEHDLDLSVKRNNALVGESENDHSSTEMCYFPISNSDFKYQIIISNWDDNLSDVKFGYAWSTDCTVSTPEFQYGAYYIRNADTNKYLTYNSAGATDILKLELNSVMNQNDFSQNHKWVLDNHNCTTIKAASDTGDVQLGISTTFYDANSRYARTSIIEKIYYPIHNSDGTYSILIPTNIGNYALSYNNDSVVWKCINNTSEITQSEKWYFDKSNYLIMDANADGSIDTSDVTFIQQSLVGLETPSNIQTYLGDVNRNGEMDIMDAYEILVYLS